jgi:tetratricopeptide (TPR) repeat protein
MAVDPYSLCPCGSGKKLKFCCTDLVGEIEKIYRLIEGDQSRAALQQVEQSLKRHPNRASLLDIKAMLEMSLDQFEAGAATVEQFLAADPKNPTAHAHRAMIATETATAREAAAALQHALDLVEENLPKRVLEAIGAVAHALLLEGNIVAARAHLWLFQGIAGSEDGRALQLLVRLNQSAGLPLLLRDHFYMQWAPEGHPAEPQHDHAQMLASQGKWLQAAKLLDAIDAAYPGVPEYIYNRALLHGWVGDVEQFVAGLHAYAKCDVPLDDAVEAEAVAQILDPSRGEEPIDSVRQEFAVSSEDELIERLNRDGRTSPYQLNPEEWDEQTGPAPRFAWLLLDRPAPASGQGITRDTVPRIVGFLSYYGRQTDRPERLELVTDRDEKFGETLQNVAEIGGDLLGPAGELAVVSQANRSAGELSWRWHFPFDTPIPLRQKLATEERHEAVLKRWPHARRANLGGRTPAEAAQDPSLKIPVLAAILTLEQGANNSGFGATFQELRQSLGLPQPASLSPEDVDVARLPLLRVPRLDLSSIDEEELVALYRRAMVANAAPAIKHCCLEVLRRPNLTKITQEEAYNRLVQHEEDPQVALKWVAEGRASAEAAGKSSAMWDITELELLLMNNMPEDANRVLRHLREEHLSEPGVSEEIYKLLYALGITPDLANRQAATRSAPVAPASPAGKIWTPESEAAGAGAGQKLWVPG